MSIVAKLRMDPHYLRRERGARILHDRCYAASERGAIVRVTEYLYGGDRIKQVLLDGETVRVVKVRIAPRRLRA